MKGKSRKLISIHRNFHLPSIILPPLQQNKIFIFNRGLLPVINCNSLSLDCYRRTPILFLKSSGIWRTIPSKRLIINLYAMRIWLVLFSSLHLSYQLTKVESIQLTEHCSENVKQKPSGKSKTDDVGKLKINVIINFQLTCLPTTQY